ncbi:MAG: hypothetical protein ABSG96_03750 [Terracidiphilus sp.]|jgi:hypothetical protein
MKVLSASEAIGPALLRTYSYLFRGFQWEVYLKLAIVATVSEGFLISFKFWVPHSFPFEVDAAAWKSFLLTPEFLPVTILAVVAIFVAVIYAYLLVIRLRFSFIHSLLHQTREFRTASKLYTLESDRFFTACVLVWLSFLVVLALLVVVFVLAAYTVVGTPTPEGKLDPGNFLILLFPCIGLAFAFILGVCTARVVLNDFILPHMAVEGASFGKAWTAVRAEIAANKETFISFLILRMTMLVIAGMILGFVAWVLGLIVFGILGMSAAGFIAMLDGANDVREYILMAARVVFMLLGLGAGVVVAAIFSGPINVFIRSYALFYYGGHYKALGNLLEPSTPESVAIENIARTQ